MKALQAEERAWPKAQSRKEPNGVQAQGKEQHDRERKEESAGQTKARDPALPSHGKW